jgi:hypothetical protein
MLSRKGTKFFYLAPAFVCTIYPFVFLSLPTTMDFMQISGAEQLPEGARLLNRYNQRAGRGVSVEAWKFFVVRALSDRTPLCC